MDVKKMVSEALEGLLRSVELRELAMSISKSIIDMNKCQPDGTAEERERINATEAFAVGYRFGHEAGYIHAAAGGLVQDIEKMVQDG